MRVKSDLLFFKTVGILIVHFVFGSFDVKSQINAICRLKCDFNLNVDKSSKYCDPSCQVDECNKGCNIYPDAITKAPCQSVCSDHVTQVSSYLVQSRSLSQIKVQSCTQGCMFSLDEYYDNVKNEILKNKSTLTPTPEVLKDSITYNSVELSLPGFEELLTNFTYILQTRVIDTNTEWQLHNFTGLRTDGSLNVTNLLPYITYQFKLIFKITTEHTHNYTTQESVPVSTLPFGVPSSSPVITNLRAPRPAVISVSWESPAFTNGPLVSYRLSLRRLDNSDHLISADVSPETTSWIFGHLHAGQKYEVQISAVNREGEGPVRVMRVATPNPGNLSEKDMPYLILGAENFVVKQRLLELTREADKIYTRPKSIFVLEGAVVLFQSNATNDLIEGVGVHIREELILISDSSGRVSLINISGDVENDDVYPMLVQPTNINIDWLNDLAYVIDGNRIYRCTLEKYGAMCHVVLDIAPLSPYELKVDPINGYLYYTVIEGKKGFYRVDLAQFDKSTSAIPDLLIQAELKSFFIDHENLLLYFPNNSKNTIMSAYLDGTGIKDIREGSVARPHFINIESIICYDEKFFWTNGTKVFSEEYDAGNRTYYHNSLLLFEKHFRGFNMLYPPAQPFPAPVNPPDNLQGLFTAYKAVLKWEVPDKLVFQGNGAYNVWEYEVYILQDDGSKNSFEETTKDMVLEISNLEPDTRYQVKVRAKSSSGTGPWSDIFYGRTIKEALGTAKIILAVKGEHKIWEIAEVEMDGELPEMVVDTSPLHIGVTDLAWYEDKVFWTTDAGDLFMYWGDTQEMIPMAFVTDATCVAYDWLGMKLYWSAYRNGVIRRSEMTYGSDIELVFQAQARDMVIDSIRGRLYWVTLNTVETTFLNGEGHKVYFQEKYFSGKNVISLSVDFETMKIFWYMKGFEAQSLYMADLFGGWMADEDVLSSVQLVGSFRDIAERSSIQYFSDHLFWLDNSLTLTVGDKQCNYTSEIAAVTKPVTMFTIKHPSLQPYPDKLDKSTVQVVPSAVQSDSIMCKGNHSLFNITWEPAVEVNHGVVLYELSLVADESIHTLNVTKNPWYEIGDLPPYTSITVSVRGFTYWGSGPLITRTVKSPMGVPSWPQAPKVYVTQRKSAASSKLSLAADFRWSEPEEINGVLSHQHVIYWKSSNVHAISSTTLSATARHFILDGLEGNTTYFFQVECCTTVGCSKRSVIANATADAVNPVPKLLIAMEDRIEMAEADNVKNTSEIIATKSVIAMGYLALDKTFFWITRDKVLEKYPTTTNQQLLKLSGEKHTMTLDWVSRSLYIAEINRASSRILRYQIDQSEHSVFMERNQMIGQIVVNPYTSSLIWSERSLSDNSWQLMETSTSRQDTAHHFSFDHRGKRAVNNVCNCPPTSQVSSAMAVDLSQNGDTEVIFVDTNSLNLLAADMAGCECRVLLTTMKSDRKGLPPDFMTVDHVHIYWYQSATETLYAMDKASKMVSSSSVEDVSDILAFGSHLHPLPGPECLDMKPYTKQVGVETVTNTSITVGFDEITWPEVCTNISHPSVKYTIHYRVLDDMNPDEDCGSPGFSCLTKEAYYREITLDGLEPYTYYIVQGAVSNYFSEYSSNSLGEPISIRTRPGVPEVIENFTTVSQSPHSIQVMWPAPYPPNGPLDKIVYFVKWSTQSPEGISQNFISDRISFEAFSPYFGLFEKSIFMLSQDQTYTVKVVCNQTDGGFVTESLPQTVHTYQEPEDVRLLVSTNTSISLTWKSPSDDSIKRVGIYCTQVIDGKLTGDSIQGSMIIVKNYTEYNDSFYNLIPNTDYSFRLDIIYMTSNAIYHMPEDETGLKYVFRTQTGIPAKPDCPTVEEFKDGEFEVVWKAPDDRGEPVTHYMLQYRVVDKENWSFAYNTSDLRWVMDDRVLQRGYTYVFRVLAENNNGIGNYSVDSDMFSYPIKIAEEEKGMVTVIAVVSAFVLVFIAMLIIFFCKAMRKKGKEEKKKERAVARGPDLELATLRELPLTGVQQNNTLYAINLIPTDDEIAALPHFRRDQLVLCKFLGSGAFGEVFEGVAKNILNDHSGETRCAVKTLRKSASDQEKEEFLKEALLMSNFRHEHILSLLGVCLDNDPQFIILELMEGGDLLSFMRACRLSSIQNRAELSLTDIVKICVHVARGCKYLEDMHFVHRDLAARNCLVSSYNPSTMVVKIGDFGLARDIYKNDYYRKEGEGLLPVRWMSPESLVDGVFTTQSDIWAFGVLMWEVVTFGQQPYPARTNIEVLHYVRSGGRLDRHDNCPDDFYQLMCKCWSFASEDRPAFAYLLQQLEKFEETCASVSDYLVPIRTTNGPINTGLYYREENRQPPKWGGQDIHPSEPKINEESGWVQVPPSEKQEADVDLIRWT